MTLITRKNWLIFEKVFEKRNSAWLNTIGSPKILKIIPFSTDVLWRKTTLKKEFDKQKCSLLKIKTRKTIWTKDIELTKKIQQRQIITFNTWFSSTSHLTRTSARFNFNGTSLFFYIFHRIFQSRWKIYRNGRDHSYHNSALS